MRLDVLKTPLFGARALSALSSRRFAIRARTRMAVKKILIFFDILDIFASCSEKEDRDTVVIRYFRILRNAISQSTIFNRDAIWIETIESFCWDNEMTEAMLALMPSVLYRWAMPKLNRRIVSRIILRVLKICLESPVTLQNLLGTGTAFLKNTLNSVINFASGRVVEWIGMWWLN
ncbi:hypothetical protein PRIPAC_89658 [Pristionchus pacificus]|uniref:Uncharacterized protein n=1 Tax=Pristionchus pacificus TaxID=54126 RepID=A0A2A6CZG7_PRIPA|nr:hypothetical protein PRIPAC_89658 [Pristionchus pacificus]|eukprot:PDM83486.1 hypothetical protein PRIPAC_35118 [Pristionchus pacificus]